MSIGWVMFGKALVLGLWAIFEECWQAFKRSRRDAGLPLKLDPKTGVYVVDDWPERLEFFVVRWFWRCTIAFFIFAFATTYWMFSG